MNGLVSWKANIDSLPGAKTPAHAQRTNTPAHTQQTKSRAAPERRNTDTEVANNPGVLGSLRDGGELVGVFGSSGLSSELSGGIGGLIGAKGTQIGSGGLGARGTGLGSGGSSSGNSGAKGKGGTGRIGGSPVILGALDKSLIDAVIKKHMNQIRYCYQRQLNANPRLAGKVVVKFVIAKDGSVSKASTKTSTLGSAAVEGCINGRFMRFRFPEPKGGGIVIVSYPFIFEPR